MSVKSVVKNIFSGIKRKQMIPIYTQIDSTCVLEDKIALITGGSGGIGMAIANEFILSGCKVIIVGTNEEKLKNCCYKLGEKSRYIVGDISDIGEIKHIVEASIKLFDEERIDILVNAAGVHSNHTFFDVTEEEYDNIMNVNLKGTFFICQEVSRYMIKSNIKGHILNISSASAMRPANTPYKLSKWGIKGFTVGLADKLLPYGIVVNAIAPGPVATEMLGKNADGDISMPSNPSGRYSTPKEIASLAKFMVSDTGNLIVGDTFYMTGGSGIISLHD